MSAYTHRNTMRLIASSVVLTDGETPSAVVISPCTSHGWRPFSVSIHPAVFMRKGVKTAQVATARNNRDVASFRLYASHAPNSAMSTTALPRYAMTLIDQYCTNTFGT